MPPNVPYGQRPVQAGVFGQPFQAAPLLPYGQAAGMGYGQPVAAPYGPPPGQSAPLYGAMPPGSMADVPYDPYAWQRAAMRRPGLAAPNGGFAPPATASPRPAMPAVLAASPGPAAASGQPWGSQAVYAVQPQPAAYLQSAYRQPAPAPAGSPAGAAAATTPVAAIGRYAQRPPAAPAGAAGLASRLAGWLAANPKRLIAGGAVAAVALVAVVGLTLAHGSSAQRSASGVQLLSDGGQTADQLFQSALANALQTKNYDQTVTGNGQKVERRVDVTDIKAPRISGNATLQDGTVAEGYAGRDDTLVKLSKYSLLNAKPQYANRWVQVRKGGASLDTAGNGGATFDTLFSPTAWMYNSFIWGNYSAADRSALLSVIQDRMVYRYDPRAATQTNLDGQTVTQYKVTLSSSGQQALLTKAAQLAGIDAQRISQAVTFLRLSGSANGQLTVSISTRERQIIQVADNSSRPQTATYSGFGITKAGQMPQAEFTWDDYVHKLKGQ